MATMNRAAIDARTNCLCWPRWVVSVALALVVVAASGAGQDGKGPSAGKEKRVLFDGKSLKGWKKADFFNAGEVKVDEGKIIISAGRSMSGITSSQVDLPTTNYELTYEAMRTRGTGLFRRGHLPGRQVVHHARERGLGWKCDWPFQSRWRGRLRERDHAVRSLSGQDLVPRSGSG